MFTGSIVKCERFTLSLSAAKVRPFFGSLSTLTVNTTHVWPCALIAGWLSAASYDNECNKQKTNFNVRTEYSIIGKPMTQHVFFGGDLFCWYASQKKNSYWRKSANEDTFVYFFYSFICIFAARHICLSLSLRAVNQNKQLRVAITAWRIVLRSVQSGCFISSYS